MFAIIDNSTKITFMHIIIFILYNYLDMKIVSQRAEEKGGEDRGLQCPFSGYGSCEIIRLAALPRLMI